MACVKPADCPGTGFACKMGMCACGAGEPDICGTGAAIACVSKMTDEANCGECGKTCDAGAACSAGVCSAAPVELTKGTGCGPMRLAIAGANIYWTEEMSGKVRTMPVAGGTPMDLAMGQLAPTAIVADATGVYWVNSGDATTKSQIMKLALPAAPAAAPVVVTVSSTTDEIFDLALAGTKLYYSHFHSVHEVATAAAAPSTTMADPIVGNAVDFDTATVKGEPHGVAVNATFVGWTDVGERNGVETDDLLAETGDPTMDKTGYHELAQSVGSISNQVAMDATYVYWCDGARFVRNKADAAMPIPDPPIAEALSDIQSFAITATDVYMLTVDGTVAKATLAPAAGASTAPTPIAVGQMVEMVEHGIDGTIAVDATKVYWATQDCAIRSSAL
jgi:hypothetical protein